jgi:hypothetical protein
VRAARPGWGAWQQLDGIPADGKTRSTRPEAHGAPARRRWRRVRPARAPAPGDLPAEFYQLRPRTLLMTQATQGSAPRAPARRGGHRRQHLEPYEFRCGRSSSTSPWPPGPTRWSSRSKRPPRPGDAKAAESADLFFAGQAVAEATVMEEQDSVTPDPSRERSAVLACAGSRRPAHLPDRRGARQARRARA